MAPIRRIALSKASRWSGREVARAEAQQALDDLQVVLHAMIDLAQEHLALGGCLALLGEGFLRRREEPRVEVAERARGGEALVG